MNNLSNNPMNAIPHSYPNAPFDVFDPKRIFLVYGHSGESIVSPPIVRNSHGRAVINKVTKEVVKDTTLANIEKKFQRYRVPEDTIIGTTLPVGIAAPNVDQSRFFGLLQNRHRVPDITKPINEYVSEIQKLGSELYEQTFLYDMNRFAMAAALVPGAGFLYMAKSRDPSVIGGPDQAPEERFRMHGHRHPMTPKIPGVNSPYTYLFTAPKNSIDVFTGDSPSTATIRPGIIRKGMQWKPSGAIPIVELKKRFPNGPNGDPILIKNLFENYTIGQIENDDGGCVSNYLGTQIETDFKQIVGAPDTANLLDLVRDQIKKVESYIVWDILPIPGTDIILTKTTLRDCKMDDIFNKPINSEKIVNYIRRAAGPGPILVIFHHCRSVRIRGYGWGSNVNNVWQREATAQLDPVLGRRLLARTKSNLGQTFVPGVPGGGKRRGTRRQVKLNRRKGRKTVHRRR